MGPHGALWGTHGVGGNNRPPYRTPRGRVKSQTLPHRALLRSLGRTINQLASYIVGEAVTLASLDDLIGVLELAFGDPNKAGTVQRELEKLKIGAKDTFLSYFINF